MQRFIFGASSLVVAALMIVVVIGRPATAQDDDAAATATRAAELDELNALRTEVAALQTQVAELSGTPSAGAAIPVGTPVTCGTPVRSWGTPAIASDVAVALLEVAEPATTAELAPAGSHSAAFEVEITNQGAAPIHYRPADFVVTDCLGNEYASAGLDVEPAIGEGDLAPGASIRGWVTVLVPDGVQLALFQYNIQESDRTGANVQFILVDMTAPDATP